MPWGSIVLLLGAVAAKAPQPETVTYWIDALRFTPQDSLTVAGAVARTVAGKRVTAARRREEADLLLKLRLGPARAAGEAPPVFF
jgi:hypothetical protein